jgi:hypothetical protein
MLPTFEDFAASLKRLKVACIMDEFTFNSYRNECNLLQLTPTSMATGTRRICTGTAVYRVGMARQG